VKYGAMLKKMPIEEEEEVEETEAIETVVEE